MAKVGPGAAVPNPDDSDAEPWAEGGSPVRYLPLQAREDDYALFLRGGAVEIGYGGAAYLIVTHGAIPALARPQHPEDAPDFGA